MNNRIDKHKFEKIISTFQIEADECSIKLLLAENTLKENYLHMLSFNVVDFSPLTLKCLIPMFCSHEGLLFLLHNELKLKRKLTIEEFLLFGRMYRIIVEICKYQPSDLFELRKLAKQINKWQQIMLMN